MSRIHTATSIADQALAAIGEWPRSESAPDGDATRRALEWLDFIMGETVGTQRMFSRFDDTLSLPIVNGTPSYDLYAALDELPEDGLEYIVAAWLENGTGKRVPLEIVTRQKFEDVEEPAKTGTPRWINILSPDIDDGTSPILRIYPTPAATDSTVWTIKLVCQRYAPNVAPQGVTGDVPVGAIYHQFGQAWQRWLVIQLTHDLGSGFGGFGALPEQRLTRFAGMAVAAKTKLDAFTEREHETTDAVGEPWGATYG